jgi:hypothetical protein
LIVFLFTANQPYPSFFHLFLTSNRGERLFGCLYKNYFWAQH